jgi:sterol desaturase/sphingolipid hydroxylase (fatty acid hydroxylase superfamily)
MCYYAVSRLGLGGWTVTAVFFAGGFFWTFFEYLMHRFVFHYVAESERARRIVYIMHGNHHHFPRDRERLFMPPVPSLIIASVLFSIQYLILGRYAFAFFPGFIIGYLMYGTMHYAIHAWAPPRFLKALWRNHHLHHYKDEGKGFGVSSTIWDHVFGTTFAFNKEKDEKEYKERVKELMF